MIDRRGRRELLLNQTAIDDAPALLLESNGRSVYREIELGAHYTEGQRVDLNISYVRSVARSDLNAFTSFYDAVLWPVVGENAYGPARTDVPHRLLVRGRAHPMQNWLLVGTLDWRSGLPYSVVDAALDFVGARNDHRFPAVRAGRRRHRAPLHVRQVPAVDWRPRGQRAQLVPAGGRAGEHRVAGIRHVLQLRLPPGADPGAVRAVVVLTHGVVAAARAPLTVRLLRLFVEVGFAPDAVVSSTRLRPTGTP
ncbi:MAG: hypothetical protein QM736_04735 [Vicinamibacterales bacterium]